MPDKPVFSPTNVKPRRTGEAVDVAARYFVYELYDATSGQTGAWKALREKVRVQGTVELAVERGWVIVRDDGKGRVRMRMASLTTEGRRLARRSLDKWSP